MNGALSPAAIAAFEADLNRGKSTQQTTGEAALSPDKVEAFRRDLLGLSPVTTTPVATQTFFTPRAARVTAPAGDEKTWKQSFGTGAATLASDKSDLPELGRELGEMVAHPIETGKAIVSGVGKIGKGLASKTATALGVEQDPEQKAIGCSTQHIAI